MSLPDTEQFILDHIQTNSATREFWSEKISQWRSEGKREDEIINILSDYLRIIYTGEESTREDLEGLIDYASLIAADYRHVAFALLGRDYQAEAKDALRTEPWHWPEPYYVLSRGERLGPFSYSEIKRRFAIKELTGADTVYQKFSDSWKPINQLAESWKDEDFERMITGRVRTKMVYNPGVRIYPSPILPSTREEDNMFAQFKKERNRRRDALICDSIIWGVIIAFVIYVVISNR